MLQKALLSIRIPWLENVTINTGTGRKLWRHSSGIGTVIEYNYWGTIQQMLVADARYRGEAQFGTYGIDTANPNLPIDKYITGTNHAATAAAPIITDAQLQAVAPSLRNDNTSRNACNIWMQYTSYRDSVGVYGVPSVQHCRNLNIGGLGTGFFDLPNAYDLSVVWIESDNIDALDPTISSYSYYALGKRNPRGRFGFKTNAYARASTETSSASCIGMPSGGYIGGNAYTYKSTSSNNALSGIIPIRVL